MVQKLEEKLIFCFKNANTLLDFDLSTRNFQISTLIGSFCAKYKTFDQKNPRGVIFHDTDK